MELTMNRLLYLLYLNRADEQDRTVTKMAKLFQVSKSTVSRNMEYFVEQGIVYAGTMRLTVYGQNLSKKFAQEVDQFAKWISWTVDCDEEENRENAMQMVVHMSENMKKQLLQKIQVNKMFQHLNHRGNITFSEFSGDLVDGSYPVSFMIYREDIQQGKYLSMANSGFSHPAILKMSGDTGMIQLKAVTMERRNIMDNLIMFGKLFDLEYDQKGKFVQAAKEGDFYQIPADAFEYTFHKDEKMLIGNLMIQLFAPLANKKLHTRKAVLTLILKAI